MSQKLDLSYSYRVYRADLDAAAAPAASDTVEVPDVVPGDIADMGLRQCATALEVPPPELCWAVYPMTLNSGLVVVSYRSTGEEVGRCGYAVAVQIPLRADRELSERRVGEVVEHQLAIRGIAEQMSRLVDDLSWSQLVNSVRCATRGYAQTWRVNLNDAIRSVLSDLCIQLEGQDSPDGLSSLPDWDRPAAILQRQLDALAPAVGGGQHG